MILNCGPSLDERSMRRREAKHKRWEQWHRWFALWPVRLDNKTCAWLQYIQRKGRKYETYSGIVWYWEYQNRESVS